MKAAAKAIDTLVKFYKRGWLEVAGPRPYEVPDPLNAERGNKKRS